jgi:solute:Na+ symporter, SSS family
MNAILFAIFGYIALQFAVGVWVSRRMTTETDYILAGRTLSVPLVTFSVFATFFGSEAVTASAAAVYDKGLSGAVVDPLCYAVALIIVGVFFAARLRGQEVTTFADIFRNRFSPGVEKLVVLVLLPGSIFWAAAQIRVFGVVLNSEAGVGLAAALLIAALVVAAYSVVGGLMADAVTDTLQGIVVIAGLVILAVIVVAQAGSPLGVVRAMAPARLSLIGADVSLLGLLEKIAVPICGTIVAVELISRFLGARSADIAAKGTIAGGLMYLIVGMIPIYLGLVGPNLLPGLTDAEELVPKLAATFLPPALHVVFVGAIISAVLSTVHATLHAPAAQISHNIILKLRPEMEPGARLWTVRLSVGALSVVAYLLAAGSETIKELVETASAFGSAGVFVTMMFAMFSRYGGASSAYAAIVGGVATWALSKYGFGLGAPYVTALLVALAAYAGAAEYEARRVAPVRQ